MNLFRRSLVLVFSIIFLFFYYLVFSEDLDKSRYSSIEDVLKSAALDIEIQGMGGHEEECILLKLENPSNDTSYIWIEPGRMLSSIDSSFQDILITREEMIALAPGENRSLSIYGFCGQASNASPDSAASFDFGSMADSSVVLLAEFLNEKDNKYPTDAIQAAVWCLTDDHSITDIYNEDVESIVDLRNMVANLKSINDVWLKVEDLPDNARKHAFYRKAISGEIEIYIPMDCIVDIYVCDEYGKEWESFEKNVPYQSGTFQYSFRMTATNWPPGRYYLIIRTDGKLLFEKPFDI